MMCLDQPDRQKILDQIGIGSDAFANGFNIESMSDLWSIELLIIGKLKPADLIARLWIVRQKFRTQVGDDIYRNYMSSLADELTEEKIKMLIANGELDNPTSATVLTAIRGDMTNLTRQTQRLGYYKSLRLGSIYKVKKSIVKWLTLVLLSMAIWLLLDHYWYTSLLNNDSSQQSMNFSLAIGSIFSGMIGSCMSLLQRTEEASGIPTSFTDNALESMCITLSMSTAYIRSLIISGAVFAMILYLLAVSGNFDLGGLFPKLELRIGCSKSMDVLDLFGCVSNGKNAYPLMLIWAFMAGFAERLVPDFLDALMEKAKAQKPKT